MYLSKIKFKMAIIFFLKKEYGAKNIVFKKCDQIKGIPYDFHALTSISSLNGMYNLPSLCKNSA